MKITSIIFLLIFVAFSICATIVHAGSLDIKLTRPIGGHEYSVSLSDTVNAIKVKADYSYGEVQDIVTVDKGSLEFYYDKPINSKWELWFFNLAAYNNLKGTRGNFLGAGPKYYILDGVNILTFSTGVLYDYDHVQGEGLGRYSHRLKYSYKGLVNGTCFRQPAFEDAGDYIDKYKIDAVIPYTARKGKVYCQKEYRSMVGLIDDECGLLVTISFGDDNE